MSSTHSARFTLSADDFVAFSNIYAVLTPLRRVMRGLIWVIVAASIAAALYCEATGDRVFAIYWAAVAAFMLFMRIGFEPWSWRRSFARQHIGESEMKVEAGDEGFVIVTADSRGEVKWSAIRRTDDLPGHVLLWPNDRIGYIIPKRGFATPDEAQAFAALAKEKTIGKTL